MQTAPDDHQSDDRCGICGSADASIYAPRNYHRALGPADLAITDSRYGLTLTLRRCHECGFIYAAGDERRQVDPLFEGLEDHGYERTQHSRTYQMEWLLRRVTRLHPGASSLLDIGAGTGLLVRHARHLGLEAVGIEPSRSLTESARRLNGVDIVQGYFPQAQRDYRRFDIITIVDVIEHVSQPLMLLQSAAAALAPDGILVVVTPDVESVAARILKRRWWHFRLAHVGYFSRSTLLRAAALAGLQPIERGRPKWFFPIGYLAVRLERYLPVHPVNRFIPHLPGGRWLYSRVVGINLGDSLLVCFKGRN